MNKIILFLFAILACVALIHADNLDLSPKPLKDVPCRREVQWNFEDGKKTVKFQSNAKCLEKTNATLLGAFSEMNYALSVTKIPSLKFVAKSTIKATLLKKEIDIKLVIGGAMGFDRIIEFNDINGVTGFQPNTTDTVVKTYKMVDQTWSPFNVSTVVVDDNTVVYQATSQAVVAGCCTVKVSAWSTTSDISFVSNKFVNRTGILPVLTASTFKSSLEITNIQYSSNNGRLAISTLVAHRGKLNKKAAAVVSQERPDDATSDQSVDQFDGGLNDQVDAQAKGAVGISIPKPFFSFQTFVSKYPTSSPTTISKAALASTEYSDADSDDQASGLKYGLDSAVVKRFWVSLSEQVENFAWDPSVGTAAENINAATSDASRIVGSALALIVVLIALLF